MKTIEMVGKTVDDAVNAALAELNAKNEDVEIEVLEEGSKGFLGMGSKDAKVRVSLKSTPQNKALEFLSQLFDVWGLNVKINTELDGDVLKVELEGDDMGIVIGKRGETLDAPKSGQLSKQSRWAMAGMDKLCCRLAGLIIAPVATKSTRCHSPRASAGSTCAASTAAEQPHPEPPQFTSGFSTPA